MLCKASHSCCKHGLMLKHNACLLEHNVLHKYFGKHSHTSLQLNSAQLCSLAFVKECEQLCISNDCMACSSGKWRILTCTGSYTRERHLCYTVPAAEDATCQLLSRSTVRPACQSSTGIRCAFCPIVSFVETLHVYLHVYMAVGRSFAAEMLHSWPHTHAQHLATEPPQ